MSTTTDNDYYHESGHVIIASVFSSVYKIDFVTLNAELSKTYDANAPGGMGGKPIKKQSELDIYDCDLLILIRLAGLCADDLNKRGGIASDLFDLMIINEKFKSRRYSGDMELVKHYLGILEPHLLVPEPQYFLDSLALVYSILDNNIIWDCVEKIVRALKNEHTRTLTADEITKILLGSNFNRWLDANLVNILEKRKALFA